MRYRKLDPNGDYSFGRGQSDFYRDQPEAVGQAVETRLGLWINEWFLDRNEGMDWNTKVLGKFTASTRDVTIIARTIGTQGVNKILSYASNLNRDARGFTAQIELDTIYGKTTIKGPI